jgi:ubiquitin-conjugating enzyme E2 N
MSISARQVARQPLIVAKQLEKMSASPHFTIVHAFPDTYDVFYILLHPQGGHYAKQTHVLELKTIYGNGDKYYFPFNPPNIKFLTRIYHTNIATTGSICLDILMDASKWSPQYTIETVMISIIALLDDPNTSSPYNMVPSKHWTKCFKDYKLYEIEHKNLKGHDLLLAKSRIFADYDQASDKYALQNKLENWAQYFPSLLDFGKIEFSKTPSSVSK